MNRPLESGQEETASGTVVFAGAVGDLMRVLLVAACLALPACSDDGTNEAPRLAPAAAGETELAIHGLDWLKITDGVPPEQWLASREAGRDLDLDDPVVADMRRVLEVATARFRDHARMIANRAVQLEGMLHEKGISERAPRLIVTLSQLPGGQRSVESFASLTQQYYNLRIDRLSRADALDALRRQTLPIR